MKRSVLLNKRDLKSLEKKLPEWTLNAKQTFIKRYFDFPSHIEALVFIARVTVHAEVLQHHPDITYTYQKVEIKSTTHDLKGLTKVDVALAERVNNLFSG